MSTDAVRPVPASRWQRPNEACVCDSLRAVSVEDMVRLTRLALGRAKEKDHADE